MLRASFSTLGFNNLNQQQRQELQTDQYGSWKMRCEGCNYWEASFHFDRKMNGFPPPRHDEFRSNVLWKIYGYKRTYLRQSCCATCK